METRVPTVTTGEAWIMVLAAPFCVPLESCPECIQEVIDIGNYPPSVTYSTPRWVGVSGGPDYLWMASVCMVCGKISAECECPVHVYMGRRAKHGQ